MKRIIVASLVLLFLLVASGCAVDENLQELYNPEKSAHALFCDCGCDDELIDITPEMVPLTNAPAIFSIPMPAAPGTNVQQNDKAVIDYSNARDGYIMAKYIPQTTKSIRVIIKGPSGAQYQYTLKPGGVFEVFPLSDGNGQYSVGVFEQVEGTKYATVVSKNITVTLADEFAPFIRPNQYVNYSADSQAVIKAGELVKDAKTIIDKISAIYNFVITSLEYDKDKAKTVQSGYLPDIDDVLRRGRGICFDYAAVMAAMLRSQNIPTKLVVGYTGDVLHAWVDVYSRETGWINSVIYFDGKSWKLMDPTFASSGNQSAEVMKFIGDGKNYVVKFIY
ncbi:MAG: transglutaminase-like domain-containing protein [Defluviitaleaceae bacterium]|nr:transglutaminase-like domain-containing protein [Defluviitaleaceae bacterium]